MKKNLDEKKETVDIEFTEQQNPYNYEIAIEFKLIGWQVEVEEEIA